MSKLKSWCLASLGDIAEIISGKNQKHVENPDGEFPIYGSAGVFGFSNKYLCKAGSIVIGRKGTINNPIFVNEKFWNVDTAFGITPYSPLSAKYLYYFCTSFNFFELDKSTTIPSLAKRDLLKIEIPIPPENEQHRIVEKIEELFSELDNGIESLKTAREQLKVYRQALLKHAFEGKLTAQWREENKDKLETTDQLLARIKQERETRYQQQLEKWNKAVKKWETDGKEGKKPVKSKQSAEKSKLTEDELTLLPKIPENYAYTYLAELGDLGRGKSKHRPRNDPKLFGGKYPFIQTGEVKAASRVVTTYVQTLSDVGLAQSKLWPKGTLCITIAANIAETAFLGFDGCFPDSVVGFTAFDELILPKYIEFFIMSVRARVEAYAPATAQKNINLTTLENLIVPLTSLAEQEVIVNILDEKFSVIDHNIKEIDGNILHSEILRQSILKKAFSGQLVHQDANDEPASELLKRIVTEKAKIAEQAKSARATAKETTGKAKSKLK